MSKPASCSAGRIAASRSLTMPAAVVASMVVRPGAQVALTLVSVGVSGFSMMEPFLFVDILPRPKGRDSLEGKGGGASLRRMVLSMHAPRLSAPCDRWSRPFSGTSVDVQDDVDGPTACGQ